jgi:hypothetical protein
MNKTRIDNAEAEPSKIDQILVTEEELIPSSGFLASVMERVHDEARMPTPLPFPWKRAIPGIVLASGVFGWGAVEFARQAIQASRTTSLTQLQIPASVERPLEQAGWVALALVISFASWVFSRRLAGQSS